MKGFRGAAIRSSSGVSIEGSVVLAAVLAILAVPSQANEPPPSAAHEHGVAKLRIVMQGQRLAFAFDSPAINVLGFEAAPQSEDQQRAVSYAKGQLQQAPRLFNTSPGANCRLFSLKVDEPTWDSAVEHHDYRARYVFQCQRPQLLQAIDVPLINQLAPGTKLLTEVRVGSAPQSVELKTGRITVRIPQ